MKYANLIPLLASLVFGAALAAAETPPEAAAAPLDVPMSPLIPSRNSNCWPPR